MQPFDAIILGLVQGIAEFLPISSSGHLIVARELLGVQVSNGLAVDAVLQLVTAFAVVVYYRVDLLTLAQSAWHALSGKPVVAEQRTMLVALAVGTIPAVIAGLLLEDAMDTLFRDPTLVAWVLIAGSGLFLLAEYVYARHTTQKPLTMRNGLLIGCFQALALVPGVSRSGATIAGGMLLGMSRENAARFAFLLSVPIIVGAGTKKLLELGTAGLGSGDWQMIALASVVSFCAGIASIHYLLKLLRNHSLMIFVVYRVALAVLVLALVA